MAQSDDILAQLLQFGCSNNEIILAIRQATNPNDMNEILDIINKNQLQEITSSESAFPKKQEEKKEFLPPGWEKYNPNDGKVYYKNHNDCSTHWNIPKEAYWTKCITKDGKEYYKCYRDKTTHWKLPKGIKLSQKINQQKQIIPNKQISNKQISNKQVPKQSPQIIPNKQISNKPNKSNKKPKTEYINETLNDEQQVTLQQQMIINKLRQQIAMQQLRHQQNMFNLSQRTFEEIQTRQHVTNMNIISNINGNGPTYYLKKDYPYGL
eukprot:386376_1